MLSASYATAQNKIGAPLSDLFFINEAAKSSTFSKNVKAINETFESKPRKVIVPLAFLGDIVNVVFKKQNLLNASYKLLSSKGEINSPFRPIFYSGIVAGQNNSTAFLTISKDNISLNVTGIGQYWSLTDTNSKAKSNQYVLSENILAHTSIEVSCDSNIGDKGSFKNSIVASKSRGDDGKVSIYIEADHQLFLQFGSISATVTYIQSVFAQVALIYANENIDIEISEIKVWDTPDPYNVTTSKKGLSSFGSTLNGNFTGDIAHLLSGNSSNHGGKAYIDALCDKSRAYAYSNILGGSIGLSEYNWDAFIISHEMGHTFGSRHTHDCIWGPNGDKALDDCGRVNETCDLLNPNPTSGTIMSYCHLDPIGISFSEGFGAEPGDLIRSKYNSCKANTGINCSTAIEITSNGKFTALGPVKGFGASQINADHSNWYKFTAPTHGKIKIFNCASGVDSRLWIHSGDCRNMIIVANSDDSCGNSDTYDYSSSIPQLIVTENETIYLEWDDRWSGKGFDFYFKFGPDNS